MPAEAAYNNIVQTFDLAASRFVADPTRGLIYASITGSNTVAVIDPSNLTVIKMITVGAAPLGMDISPGGGKLYVALSGTTRIAVVDLVTLTALPTITVDVTPTDLVAGLDDRLYVIYPGYSLASGLVQVNAVTGATEEEIAFGVADPEITADRKTLYVRTAGFTNGGIYRYDVSSPTADLLESAPAGIAGQNLKLSHNEQFLCVPISYPDFTVQLIDAGDLTTVLGTLPARATAPDAIALSPSDTTVFAEGQVFDAQSFLPIASVAFGDRALITDNTGRYLLFGGDAITVYDLLPEVSESMSATLNKPFSYETPFFIANRTNSATGLPTGLAFDPETKTISGTPTQHGVFPIVVTMSDGTNTAIVHVNLTVYPNSRAQNISTRLFVQTGNDVLIGGFIISGSYGKQIVLRAIGPSLPIGGSLVNPTLELHDSTGAVIAFNDDWAVDPQALTLINLGFAPSSSQEAALYRVLPPGSYTMIVRGADNASGIGLVEVYDLDSQGGTTVINGSRLANISTRGKIETADNVMIGGVIVGGIDDADMVVRAIGPSLTSQGVSGALADPVLNLYDDQGVVIAFNDNWRDTQQSAIEETGLAPMDDKESAIVISLAPGAYTAIVSGVEGAAGVGLVEAYNLP